MENVLVKTLLLLGTTSLFRGLKHHTSTSLLLKNLLYLQILPTHALLTISY